MRCKVCEREFSARADAKFCSVTCRVHAHRHPLDGPPRELRVRPRWVCHRMKAPRVPFGAFASTTNPTTWRDYDTAVRGAAARGYGMDGIGFVFNGDGIAGIDLDKCIRDDGTLEPWAQEIVDRCPGTYIEVSPSGRGLHVIGYAEVGTGRRNGGVEVYDRGRYFTITGNVWGNAPRRLADISTAVAAI